jgi:hypothetical protein
VLGFKCITPSFQHSSLLNSAGLLMKNSVCRLLTKI